MSLSVPPVPKTIEELEELLSRPTEAVIETFRRVEGDVLFLGAGGKIGPSLARMAARASRAAGAPRRIFAAARFSSPVVAETLRAEGIEPIRCDLLDPAARSELPDIANVFYLAAMKFGATGQEATTWAMNSFLPGAICEKYGRSRLVAYSTGNVYPLWPAGSGGPRESDPVGPIGEYAMSCLGRERVVQHFSRRNAMPAAILRLNYAHDLRYGVMTDIALEILAGRPIDLAMGHFNAIWQGDSNAMTLRALEHAAVPPGLFNLAGPELSVRAVAEQLGRFLEREVRFAGAESSDALLSNGELGRTILGQPTVAVDTLIAWVAQWLRQGGATLNKPTKFQARDGKF